MNKYTLKVIKEAIAHEYKMEKRLSQIISSERDKHLENMECLKEDYKKMFNENINKK